MVDMDKVKERLLRGAFVGAGSFTSSFIGSYIEDTLPGGDIATGAGQVAVGLGVSVGVDEVLDQPESIPNEAGEFVGYGIQGAGFANLGESLKGGIQTGAQTGNVVSVTADTSQVQDSSPSNEATATAGGATDFSLDTA